MDAFNILLGKKALLTIALVLSMLLILKDLVWLKGIIGKEEAVDVSMNITEQQPELISNTSLIIQKNLFGAAQTTSAPVVITENLPETNLNLILRGVVTSSTNSQSSAMIEGADGVIVNYFSGSEIEAGTIIDSIYKDRVVLERRGRLETLYFLESQGSSASRQITRRPRSASPSSQSRSSQRESISERDARLSRQISQQQASTNQRSISERLNQLRSNN